MANDEVSILLRIRGRAKASQEVKQLRGDMGKLDDSQGRVAKSSDRAAKSSGRLSKGIGALSTAAKIGIAATGLLAWKVGKYAVTAASDLGEQVNKASVVFRGSERDVISWSKTTAGSFGISQRQALESAGIFGNMLVPMGVARDKAGDMSKRMVELAADMSSFNNANPEETLDALRAGLAGETEPLRRFGVFLNEARIQQQAMSMGLVKGKQPLDAQSKAMATYALILKDTKDAQGDFSRTGTSLPNLQRRLAATWENIAAKGGKLLLPVLQQGAEWLFNFLTEVERGTGTGGAFVDALESVGLALTGVYGTGVTVVNAITDVVNGFREGKTWAVLLVGGVATLTGAWLGYQLVMTALAVKTAVMTGAQWALNAAMTANPVGLIVAGIAALIIGLVLAYKKVGWFRNAVNAVFGFIKKHWMALAWILTGGLVPIIVLIVRNFGKIRRAAGSVIGFVKKNWPILIGILTGGLVPAIILVVRNFGKIKKAASDAFNGVRRIVKSVVNGIIGIWNRLDFGIHIRVPSWVPGVGGKGFNVNDIFPDIPQLQYGGVTGGGPVLWNERVGGEIAMFPRGTRIEPTARVDRTEPLDMGSGDIVIENHFYVDGHEVAKIVDRRVGNARARR